MSSLRFVEYVRKITIHYIEKNRCKTKISDDNLLHFFNALHKSLANAVR